MIIKMRGNGVFFLVVRGNVYRRKIMYIHIPRDYHNSRGVLPRSRFYAHYAACHFFDKRAIFPYSLFFIIFNNVAKRRFIRYGGDSSRAVRKIFAKHYFRKFMGFRLINSRKVQVNIGLFVAVKSHKHGERNIVTVLNHRFFAIRAVFRRQIVTATDRAVGYKLRMFAFFAAIMRRQRIYFRYPHHSRDERRTHRPPRTYQISVDIGFFHEFFRD